MPYPLTADRTPITAYSFRRHAYATIQPDNLGIEHGILAPAAKSALNLKG